MTNHTTEGHPAIINGISYSNMIISRLRDDLKSYLDKLGLSDDIAIAITGSFGRKEASANSDLDYFIIYKNDESLGILSKTENIQGITALIKTHVPKDPGSTGTFGEDPSQLSSLYANIGGEKESNKELTRRLLLILEGDWIYGEKTFNEAREALAQKYLASYSAEKVPKFFLNDIIRYHRTIAVDFEKKIQNGKGWGLRNVKLRLSRKMLYFGGLIAATELINHQDNARKEKLLEIINIPAIERISRYGSCPKQNKKILDCYNKFLEKMESSEVREELENLARNDRENSENFKELRTLGESMTADCFDWIKIRHNDKPELIGHLIF